MESLDFAKKVLRHVWAEFIEHFDAAANAHHLYSKELIDDPTMDLISKAKSEKDANQAFLLHLRSNATIESLEKLCTLLHDTARDHQRHDSLAKSLEDELKQPKVPLPSPEAVQKGGRGGDGPSYSQSITSTSVPVTPAPTTLSPGTSVPGPTAPGAPMSSPPSHTSGDGTSSADVSQHDVYYPVIDDLKISFSNLAGNVLSIIGSLSSENLETFCYFLSNYLKPSFPPNAPLPVIPETFPILKLFLIRRWDPLQIALLKAVVQHLASRRIQAGNVKKVKAELNAYEDLLKGKLPEFLNKCRSESVSLQSYPGQSSVSVKIASNPAEISLSRIVKLKGFFIHNLGLPDTLFTGFSEGSIVLFFSIPTECVCSLPYCLLPSNLSLLEEWKVLFLSVKGACTVDIKERRVIDSLDKHSLLSSLAEDKTLIEDLRAKVQQLQKEKYLHFKKEELRAVMETEVKVSRKWKDKAAITDQEVPLSSPEAVQKGLGGMGGDGPYSSQSITTHAVPSTSVPATFPPGSSSPEPPAPYTPAPTTLSPGTSVPGPTAPGAPVSSPPSYTSAKGTTSVSMSHSTVYYYPVIDKLKTSFSNLAENVLSIIDSLPRTSLKSFRTHFLSNYLKPSFSPDAPLPVIPETVEDLKLFLTERWDPLQIALLKAVVNNLGSKKRIKAAAFKANIQQVVTELEAYENLLKGELSAFLSKCRNDTLRLKTYPGHFPVSVKIDSKAAEISLARILELQDFFIDKLGLPDTLFTGFSEGSIVLFFSIPAECVCSLPSCLLPSNLSLLEEWKVLFLSVKGAFTVDIKERRVIDSLDKHSLLSSLAEYQTLTKDLRTKVQQMEKDLYFKEEELWVMEREVKVSKKGKGKAVSTDQEIEEKVSFKEESVVKTKLPPDVKSEPSSKRFKTAGPEYLTYEPPLEKKAEEKGQDTLLQAKDTQIAKLLEEIRRLKQENNLLHQTSFIAEEPASSISPAKPFKPEQNKVFRSDLVRPGEHHSVKMPDLLIPTCDATPVTIGRDVYLAGGLTSEVETAQLVQVYNMDSGDCRTLPPSPQYWSAAVAIDGTLVLIGGCDSSTGKSTNMVSTWMAAEERWTQDLPPVKMKRLIPGVLLLNNHLFVFGGMGEDAKTYLDSFEVLDLNTKQWSEGRGGLPQPSSSQQLGVFGDYVMLYGGWTSAGRVTRACYTVPVQVLVNSVTNPLSPPIHWTPVQAAPYDDSALLTTSQDAVLIGGESIDAQAIRAIHRFSSSGSWEVIGALSEPRARPAVVAVSERSLLVLTGDSDPSSASFSTLLKSVELISY